MGINWDTAGYATGHRAGVALGEPPWNSHYGVGQVYWLTMHLAPRLGLTALDGLRLLNALALRLAASAVVLNHLRPPLAAAAGPGPPNRGLSWRAGER